MNSGDKFEFEKEMEYLEQTVGEGLEICFNCGEVSVRNGICSNCHVEEIKAEIKEAKESEDEQSRRINDSSL